MHGGYRTHSVRLSAKRILWLSSSLPQLRKSSFFLVMSVTLSSAENCTLCPGGEQITSPGKRLDFEGRLEVHNCSALSEFALSLNADSDECADIQGISPICGCPLNDDGCKICPDGSAITKPETRLPYPEDFLGHLVPPTCGFFEAALGSVEPTSKYCRETQLISTLCGCPIQKGTCAFCPNESISTPQKDISHMFHAGEWFTPEVSTCETYEAFVYGTVEAGTSVCRVIEMHNFVCGCSSVGHRLALIAWLPRISGILSILGSSFIIQDVLKDRKKRRVPYHQLVLGMSHFDLISSIWWSLSTLVMPEVDENGDPTFIYGAKGNQASCKAQGFFLQLGIASPFFNLSLAIYYLLVVSFGWSEVKIRKVIGWMHAVPFLTGLGLALGGIPFYGPGGSYTVCYIEDIVDGGYDPRNALIFFVIPISIVILLATMAMVKLFWSVYRKEKASSRWASKEGMKMSRKVFWQAFWYLTSFYVSWPILIALNWVDTNPYTNYWFGCLSLFLMPIQGFLNFIVYIRPRVQGIMDKKKRCSCFSFDFLTPAQKSPVVATARPENDLSSIGTVEPSPIILHLHAGSVAHRTGESGQTGTSNAENELARHPNESLFADDKVEHSLMRDPSVRIARCA